ncbi:MAG TPA: tRNA (adenosine(37)-N6)-threonylcarbamoyltransferase complex dimerization subunit type 1 TsaB [Candidatus Cybelea sp.]|jgi:tRNA threonylcarbamoyladenosine biosynthesis protein TsaB|nr:tRNA (adenosine(37)-N6)-threonylcarbamoyltransferase complex dimerization subunit type 1 TsaB [Candidatus Cybelea sp.]
MNVLAIDGALGLFSAAVACDDRITGCAQEPGNVALERGLTLAVHALREAGVRAGDLDRLAVGIGPGSFTGLRIAIAYAKSLAAAWRVPLVPISSFDLIEYGQPFGDVLAVVVGRPGVISARYRRGPATRRASGRIPEVLDELLGSGVGAALDVVGAPKDVLYALAERAVDVRPFDPAVTPAAAAAALAAGSRLPAASVHEVRADYGELPAAKIPKL